MTLLSVKDVSVSFGGVKALSAVTFEAKRGEIFAIIGPNGAGKTTLFNVISGIYPAHQGTVCLKGETVTGMEPFHLARLGLSRTFQNLQIFFRMTALENVMVGRHQVEKRNLFSELLGLPGTRRENSQSREEAVRFLERVGLASVADSVAGNLAYGELKRLEVARALAASPDVLLLDEPAAGCNATETAELAKLIQSIAQEGITVVLVEHDMKLVMNISDRIFVLNQGSRIAEGTPWEIQNNTTVIEAYLGSSHSENLDA